jgi:hydrogenase expression/formation protein HypD
MDACEKNMKKPLAEDLLRELQHIVDRPIRIMVVCGTHNRAILRYELRSKLPKDLELVSGPGCSVCVMPTGHIDAFVKIGLQPDVITVTCEDLLDVPGTRESLASIRAKGARVEVISSAQEGLDVARNNPDKIVVYPAVGFEATAPGIAETILDAACEGIDNFCVIPSIRLLPPTLDSLLADPDWDIDGLLCSDHINSLSDTEAYTTLARKYNLSCCIAGFELEDILNGLIIMVNQIKKGVSQLDNLSSVLYSKEEYSKAKHMVSEVFFAVDTIWRGLGIIEESGFVIRDELSLYDATKRFNIRLSDEQSECHCFCSMIIAGRGAPPDCPDFGKRCTIKHPIGPCMLSSEGICASYFKYTLDDGRIAV